mgnify:CR=1 FL=1
MFLYTSAQLGLQRRKPVHNQENIPERHTGLSHHHAERGPTDTSAPDLLDVHDSSGVHAELKSKEKHLRVVDLDLELVHQSDLAHDTLVPPATGFPTLPRHPVPQYLHHSGGRLYVDGTPPRRAQKFPNDTLSELELSHDPGVLLDVLPPAPEQLGPVEPELLECRPHGAFPEAAEAAVAAALASSQGHSGVLFLWQICFWNGRRRATERRAKERRRVEELRG